MSEYRPNTNQGNHQVFETGDDAMGAFSGSADMYTAQMAAASSMADSYERQARLSRDESRKTEALEKLEHYRALSTELSHLAFKAGKSAGSRSDH